MQDAQFYVYILTNSAHTVLYIGVTSDLPKRVWEHRNKVVAWFTSRYHMYKLVYYEIHTTMYEAIVREKRLKEWKRAWKEALISEHNHNWDDLYEQLVR